ncbi:hypothetical protein [Flavobacterium sp.]|uniref:hypothetical protein n=1 Tax=Flavobacterium sp. TaxID=239 RepID=UPI00374CB0F7
MHKHKNLLIIFLTFLTFGNLKAQDHLEPVEGVFFMYDFQVEYYPKVREILFDGLSDNPEIRYLIMPSFSGEKVLDINKDFASGKYFINFQVAEPSVWNSIQSDKKEVKVKKIKKEISAKDTELIKTLFKKAILTVKYPNKEMNGLDGTNYYFASSNKSGTIWSPKSGSKMSKLVEIANGIVEFSKNEKTDFNEEFVVKIKMLIDEL